MNEQQERDAFEAWYQPHCPIDGVGAREAAKAAWFARASLPSEDKYAFAHEIWAAAQMSPGEGIEDAMRRIAALLPSAPAAPQPPAERVLNQCDGCQRGLPVSNGLHREATGPFSCTASRYQPAERKPATDADKAESISHYSAFYTQNESFGCGWEAAERHHGIKDQP